MSEHILHLPFDFYLKTALSSQQIFLLVLLMLACLLIGLMTFRRLFSHSPLRFFAVFLANIFSMLMIAALILPIGQFNAKTTQVVLFTEGAELTYFNRSENQNQSQHENESQNQIAVDTRFYQFQHSSKASDLSSKYEITALNYLSELMLFEPHLRQLTVVGHGLNEPQWRQLIDIKNHSDIKLSFIASDKLNGFVDVKFPKNVALGEVVTVQAKLQRAKHLKDLSKFRVKLLDVNQQVLSDFVIKTKDKENPKLELKFIPKTYGQHFYKLQLLDDSQLSTADTEVNISSPILLEEMIAINVQYDSMPRILIAQSSPKYETRHLKNWASEAGAEIEVVSQISKNSLLIQKVNSAKTKVTSPKITSLENQSKVSDLASVFSLAYLTHFDMIIIDGRLLTTLAKINVASDIKQSVAIANQDSSTLYNNGRAQSESITNEINALQQAVKNGTGLLVLSDQEFIQYFNHPHRATMFAPLDEINSERTFADNSKTSNITDNIATNKVDKNSQIQAQVIWPKGQIEQRLLINQNHLIFNYNNVLVSSGQGSPLIVAKHFGLGKFAISAINSSFQWKTNGLAEQYSQFWHYLLQSLARNQQPLFWLKTSENKLLFTEQDHLVCLLAKQPEFNEVSLSATIFERHQGRNIPLQANQQLLNTSKYCVDWWQENSGWVKLSAKVMNHQIEQNSEHWLYLHSPTAWQAQKQADKHRESQLAVEAFQFKQNVHENDKTKRVGQTISKFPFFLCLLFINSLLWLERKYFD